MAENLDSAAARRIALGAAAGFPPPYGRGLDGAADFLRRVGYIQIDTISVVARSHEHVLWSRTGVSDRDAFRRLEGYSKDGAPGGANTPRRAIEYWAHAAAYLPMEEFRFCLPRMERIRRNGHEWFRADREAARAVLDRIRGEGPLSSKDFEDPRGKAGVWWDWKPAKRALEYLFHAGELLVATRSGFSKVFDLAERVIPPGTDLRAPGEAEAASRYVDRAVDACGIFSADEVAYGRKDQVAGIGAELASRVADGRLAEFLVEGAGKTTYYAAPEAVNAAAAGKDGRRRAYVLSPFDPFLIDRKRVQRLFGFDYSLECYLPEAKRRFGYFALPILLVGGDSGPGGFIGLADAKADRKARVLEVRRISLGAAAGCPELKGRGVADAARAAARALEDFGRFNGADRVVLGRVEAPSEAAAKALRGRFV